MREITLKEWERSDPVALSVDERDALGQVAGISIGAVDGSDHKYTLTPGSTIGAFEVDGLSVLIEPKIGIPQVLSLACYAIGKVRFREEDFDFREEEALPDALAIALSRPGPAGLRPGPAARLPHQGRGAAHSAGAHPV